jgi:hypothetical protein
LIVAVHRENFLFRYIIEESGFDSQDGARNVLYLHRFKTGSGIKPSFLFTEYFEIFHWNNEATSIVDAKNAWSDASVCGVAFGTSRVQVSVH